MAVGDKVEQRAEGDSEESLVRMGKDWDLTVSWGQRDRWNLVNAGGKCGRRSGLGEGRLEFRSGCVFAGRGQ